MCRSITSKIHEVKNIHTNLCHFFLNKYFEIYDEYKPVLRCVQTKIN